MQRGSVDHHLTSGTPEGEWAIALPPQFLADQLTLFQPGGKIIPPPHRFLDDAPPLLTSFHSYCSAENEAF